jgi:hypothetical protein
MLPRIRIVLLFACGALVGAHADAGTVINFDAYQQNSNGSANGEYDWGIQITVNGFTITSTPNPTPNTYQFSQLSTLGPLYPAYPGVPAMYNRQAGGGLILTKADGGTFSLLSIDLVELPGLNADGTAVRSPTGQFSVTFVGNEADGSTVSSTATVIDFADDPHLQTFNFSGFNNLVSVNWFQGDGGGYDHFGVWSGGNTHEFDNIVVNTAVPEPSMFLVFSIGMLTVAAMHRISATTFLKKLPVVL